MKLKGRSILLISPEPWDHIFVSKHHYAVNLAERGNRVYYLGPPSKEWVLAKTGLENVFLLRYTGFPKGIRYYPSFLQQLIFLYVFKRLELTCSAQFDVVWSFDNSVFFDFSFLPASTLKISHIVDFNQNFQTRRAATTADLCLCTTERIKVNLKRFNLNTFKIGHGFNTRASLKAEVLVRRRHQRLIAVYAGNLSIPYIDWSLLWQVVERNPDVDFIFLGPNSTALPEDSSMSIAKRKVLKRSNTTFPGKVDFSELEGYYQLSDVLLVAYMERYQDGQVANPHKMMEYLGSGKVIVATKTSEYEGLYPHIVMSERNSEWPQLFQKVKEQLEYYNSIELQDRRVAIARANTYEKQIEKIESLIINR